MNIITIFGCGGDRDKIKRPLMAKIAEKNSSYVYITNDNPRNEDEDDIINDIILGFETKQFSIIKDRKNAINTLLKSTENKIILILGKGIEDCQIFGSEKVYHSDIEIIKKYSNES